MFKVGDLAVINKLCVTHPQHIGKIVRITKGLHFSFPDDASFYGVESPLIPPKLCLAHHAILDPFKKPPDLTKILTNIPIDLTIKFVEEMRDIAVHDPKAYSYINSTTREVAI